MKIAPSSLHQNRPGLPPRAAPGRPSRLADVGLCVAILLVALAVFWPAVQGEFLWDDPAHVTRVDLRDGHGLWRIWFEPGATQQYYPLLHSFFWLEHRLWGDSPFGYHLVGILLHATAATLLGLLLRRLAVPGAWLASFLFLVHPVSVESVAWITEQKNTLSLVLYLTAAIAYLRFAARRNAANYALATGLFLLALLTKTVTATLPAALLVVGWWQRGRLEWRRDIAPLLPWLALGLLGGLLTAHFERVLIGAEGSDFALSFLDRVVLAGRVVWFYFGKLLWPAGVTFFYPRWAIDAGVGWQWLFPTAAFALLGALWWWRRRSRAPLAVALLFGGSLFPALGFFNVFPFLFSYVADHFQYLAMLAVIASLAASFTFALSPLRSGARTWGRVAIVGAIIALGAQSHRLSRDYKNDETLFRANIATNPTSWMGHHILAQTVAKKSPENFDEAERLYRRALELKAHNPDSHYKLGYLISSRPERRDEAIAHYREALRLRPSFPEAHNSLAYELAAIPGKQEEAIAHYRKAIEHHPKFVYAHGNLAQTLALIPGREQEALAHFNEALRLAPGYVTLRLQLANLLARQPGREAEALSQFAGIVKINPDIAEAHAGYAHLLLRLPGRSAEALAHFQTAVRLRPNVAEFSALLGNALASQGRFAEAVPAFETALRLQPESAAAHFSLANALARLPDRLPDAIAHYKSARRLRPDAADIHVNLANALALDPKRLDEAIASYEVALELNPKLASVHYDLALHLGNLPDRLADAIVHGKEAIRINPASAEAYNLLGVLLAQANDLDGARANWSEALRINPEFTPARNNLSLIPPEKPAN